MMSPRFRTDIVVTSPAGTIELIVEVKQTRGVEATLEAVAQLRTYLRALQQEPYVLLIDPSRFSLWSMASADAAPIYEGETFLLLANYIDLQKISLQQLDNQGFALVVYSWLGSVIFKPATTLLAMPAQKWLVESGLHEHIYRGFIQQESILV